MTQLALPLVFYVVSRTPAVNVRTRILFLVWLGSRWPETFQQRMGLRDVCDSRSLSLAQPSPRFRRWSWSMWPRMMPLPMDMVVKSGKCGAFLCSRLGPATVLHARLRLKHRWYQRWYEARFALWPTQHFECQAMVAPDVRASCVSIFTTVFVLTRLWQWRIARCQVLARILHARLRHSFAPVVCGKRGPSKGLIAFSILGKLFPGLGPLTVFSVRSQRRLESSRSIFMRLWHR